MKRFFFALSLLLAVSCGKNGLYIRMDNTAWETTEDTQVAWPVFLDGERVSLIQADMSSGLYQTLNGTYAVDGHRVLLTVDGTSLHITRTFSHLKNSKNKNYKRLSPVTPVSASGNLWAGLKDGNLRFLYLSPGGKCMEGTFTNVEHKEGIRADWSWKRMDWDVNGNQLVTGDVAGTFYEGFLRLDTEIIPCISTVEDPDASSSLKGTIWTLQTSSYPGFILFTSATEFTRVLVQSGVALKVLRGTYVRTGNSIEFKTDSMELNQVCAIQGSRFTYLEKTYSRVPF